LIPETAVAYDRNSSLQGMVRGVAPQFLTGGTARERFGADPV
jgi:hypothetical protein